MQSYYSGFEQHLGRWAVFRQLFTTRSALQG
jgi:hypothetical protein